MWAVGEGSGDREDLTVRSGWPLQPDLTGFNGNAFK